MKHFCVLYGMPVEGLDEWMNKPPEERKAAEETMRSDWDAWLSTHAHAVKNTIGLGKTKRVTSEGVHDVRNGFMLSSYVEAESAEVAAQMFVGHPHLTIPGATIDVIETSPLTRT